MYRTYAKIDAQRLKHNLELAKTLSASKIIAVVKANAYGHGAIAVTEAAAAAGADMAAVATAEEGFELRERFPNLKILLLGYVPQPLYKEVAAKHLLPTIYNIEIAKSFHEFLNTQTKLSGFPVALKIDTGMGRLGFGIELDIHKFKADFPHFNIAHIFSHLASSDTSAEFTLKQETLFKDFLCKCNITSASLFNSAAIAHYQNTFSHTRCGIMTYGYQEGAEVLPVMSVHSKIVHARKLKKGDTVSYGQTYIAEREMWVGVVPIGYADGYPRLLSNKGRMWVSGEYCPVIGRVCMDMTMLDISALGESAFEKPVEIMGDHVTATELAQLTNTIEYEILCGFSPRVPRI